jgi:hypothetical protein
MTVLSILGDFVEILWENSRCGEIEFMKVDKFIAAYGREALYGRAMRITEFEDGILYEF